MCSNCVVLKLRVSLSFTPTEVSVLTAWGEGLNFNHSNVQPCASTEPSFINISGTLFKGGLRQSQIEGINRFLDYWDSRPDLEDVRYLAYILAMYTMKPTRNSNLSKNMEEEGNF